MKTIADTFSSQYLVDPKTGCWIWQRARGSHGYGMLSVSGRVVLAHRHSYETAKGAIPGSLLVCHSCDNRRCVNPSHLWLGTDRDNLQDALRKGRGRRGVHRGEDNVCSKLTEQDVRQIRRRVDAGETQTGVAREFGVHKTTVQYLYARKTWRHIA